MNRAAASWQLLVVDDEPANRDIIAEILAGQPYDIEFAGDGIAALEWLAGANRCDLIVLDRMMPGIDGLEVLKRLKTEPRWALTPVIMQTAAAAPQQVREGLAAGAYYYLTKPYRPEALLGIIRSALDGLRGGESPSVRTHSAADGAAMAGCEYTFATIEEAERLATLLGTLCSDPEAVAMGLGELLLNAVEHGNLEIAYGEKGRLKREGRWSVEVERRLRLPKFRDRRARVRADRSNGEIRFTITDEGRGFDWRSFLDFDPGRAFDPNGRGIALARRLAFIRVEFQGAGNVVVATAEA